MHEMSNTNSERERERKKEKIVYDRLCLIE